MVQLHVLIARHGQATYEGAEGRLLSRLLDLSPEVHLRATILDSALQPGSSANECHAGLEIRVLGTGNEAWEFGAWDVGISGLSADPGDLVALTTSAFDQLYAGYLAPLGAELLHRAAENNWVLGHVDYFPEPVRLGPNRYQHWVRTAFIVLPYSTLLSLRPFAADLAELQFSGDVKDPFVGDFVSPELQSLLLGWLCGEGTGQGVKWHRSRPLTPDWYEEFQLKVAALLREQLLTVRLRLLGAPIVDLLSVDELEHPDLMHWRDQVRARDIPSGQN